MSFEVTHPSRARFKPVNSTLLNAGRTGRKVCGLYLIVIPCLCPDESGGLLETDLLLKTSKDDASEPVDPVPFSIVSKKA